MGGPREENAALKQEIEQLKFHNDHLSELFYSLRADNAALLECVENICACSTDDFVTSMYMVHEIQSLARECIAKLGTEGVNSPNLFKQK